MITGMLELISSSSRLFFSAIIGALLVGLALALGIGGRTREKEETGEEVEGSRGKHRLLTVSQLARYDGRSRIPGNPIYISVMGVVYDVTSHPTGRDFYGPGSSYNVFAGRDATYCLATMSLDGKMTNQLSSLKSISISESQTLFNWVERYDSKYKVVAYLKGFYPEAQELVGEPKPSTKSPVPTAGGDGASGEGKQASPDS
eukprot:GHVU01172702.1.p1 GENE.GHVU01172702.1~~GHVU01172702.1.p1  ORF type:complete len:202 (+),score=22.33 GHVU01172702.1:243-848(+)